ncbi:MAG: hypothetical protein Q8922_09870 [Bacteroidota bacterium]|nr:hypothetical protein [Bacteroidota bacterium]MDP4232862.1 hypothetical protein [Bacteroidota bacterium]MDP4241906.1 hypothetical protein [Bacteroidota bacterium]MDP4288231.1 hypothetical protein [Bacteroidota bacterium]
MKSLWKRSEVLLALGATIVACIVWQFRLRFPFDDAFISFRYAEHLASGNGLVWNIGGPPTEGYTNFLFVVMLALVRFVSSDLLAPSQMIGLLATIGSGILLLKLATHLRDAIAGIVAASLFWLMPLTWINALSGMETSLFVFFVLLSLFLFAKERLLFAFGACFLATLTRPEGAMLGGILSLTLIGKMRDGTSNAFWSYAKAAMGFAVPFMVYAVWKYFYFGTLLPNSFYVKVGEPAKFLPGLQYARLFVVSILPLVVAGFGIRVWRARPALLATALWAISLPIFYLFVTPLEGLYDRFLWPDFAAFCITGALGISYLSERLQIRALPWGIILLQFVVMLRSPRTTQSLAAHEEIWDASMDRIVTELRLLPHVDSLMLAYGDAGYVVYKSGIRHLDLVGLNDTRIAHARTREDRAAIVRDQRPDLLLLPVQTSDGRSVLVEDGYGTAPDSSFQPVGSFVVFPYRLVLFLNKNTPWPDLSDSIAVRIRTTGSFLSPPPVFSQ